MTESRTSELALDSFKENRLDPVRSKVVFQPMSDANEFKPERKGGQVFQQIRSGAEKAFRLGNKASRRSEFATDFELGLFLHDLFDGLGYRTTADTDFWRYIACKVMPDLVHRRWGDKEDYYWKHPWRIWPKRVWWFVHLIWQGNEEETRNVSSIMTTDWISAIVERPGQAGFRVDSTRVLVGLIHSESESRDVSEKEFREMMKMRNSFSNDLDPSHVADGSAGFARRILEAYRTLEAKGET